MNPSSIGQRNGQDHRARTVIIASKHARKPGYACIRLLSRGVNCADLQANSDENASKISGVFSILAESLMMS